jgi:hypothetical protein
MTRTTIVLSLAGVGLALLPAAAPAHHQPGHQGGGGGTGNLTLAATPNPVRHGRTVTFTGKLTGSSNSGRTVNLFSDAFPYDSFAAAGSAVTNTSGDYSLTHKPTLNTRYEARVGNERSAVVTVLVRPAVSLRLSDYTPTRGQRVRFSGRVCPQHDGSSLSIQRRYRTGYRTVRRTTLKDIVGSTCSSYRRTFRVYRDGRFRAVIGAHADHATGLSRSRVANAHG